MAETKNIQFFGEVDKKDGRLTSSFPAWYHTTKVEELTAEVAELRMKVDSGLFSGETGMRIKVEYDKKRQRLQEIADSAPPLSDAEKDILNSTHKKLKGVIADALFSRTDMMKGLADAHEEARRMKTPMISAYGMTDLYKAVGVNPVKGNVTRDQAARLYKIIGKRLGEPSNIEHLRRDISGGAFKIPRTIDEMEA